MLQTVGYATTVTGSIAFNIWFKEKEFRTMNVIACLVNSLGAIFTMLFCLKITLGLPDFTFCLLTSTVT
jgi:hypothetical protein